MELEARMFKVYAKGDERIQLKIIPGHFVTSQSHISHYLDMTTMKTRCAEAARIAKLLSSRYETTTPVDSIICMDGLEVIGDKRTVLLMFVAPLLILCLLNLMFSASTKTKVTIGTVDVNNQINRKMDQVDGITVKKYESEKHAKKDLDANSLDGVISYKSKQYDVTYANLDVSKTVMTKKVLESALMKDNVSKLQSMVVKQGQVIAKLTGQQESVKMNKSKISIKNHYNYGNSKTNFFDKMAPILIGFFVFFFV